jgi:hypothetical protein
VPALEASSHRDARALPIGPAVGARIRPPTSTFVATHLPRVIRASPLSPRTQSPDSARASEFATQSPSCSSAPRATSGARKSSLGRPIVASRHGPESRKRRAWEIAARGICTSVLLSQRSHKHGSKSRLRVHSPSRDHHGEGDARTRVTNHTPWSRPDPASRNACVISTIRDIVPLRLLRLCVQQPPAGFSARRVARCRIWARAKAGVESKLARRRRCNRPPTPAPNTIFTRRGLRPLATADRVIGLA